MFKKIQRGVNPKINSEVVNKTYVPLMRGHLSVVTNKMADIDKVKVLVVGDSGRLNNTTVSRYIYPCS